MPTLLADAIFWIAVACCSVAQLAIIRSVIVTPAPQSAPDSSPDGRARASRASEIAWAILPGLALAYALFATWQAMHPTTVMIP